MATTYTTTDGDTADYIAWKFYGTTASGQVERMLDANPGLADRGPILPAGLVLVLPDPPAASVAPGVKLWD